jgi:hypothetical protein
MAAPITPSGTQQTTGTVPASRVVNAGPIMNLVKTWMIRERVRVAKIIADKAWLAKDGKGQIDITASVANLAAKIQDSSDDLTVFDVPAGKMYI